MVRSKNDKSPRIDRDWEKSRKVNALISLKDVMVRELPSSLEDGDMDELSVCTDPPNQDSTRVNWKIRILDHQKILIEVLHSRLVIAQNLTENNITTGPNQYRFTQTFLDG